MYAVTIYMHYGMDRRSTTSNYGDALVLLKDWHEETGEYVEVEDIERGLVLNSLGMHPDEQRAHAES